MQFIRLMGEIREALKARDFRTALAKFIELLQLFQGSAPEGQFKLLATGDVTFKGQQVDDAVAELDAFCADYEGKSIAASDGELLKKVGQIAVKLLPILLAGL